MKYTRKELKAFFDWFEKRNFDHHQKTKENYMMEAFIAGQQLATNDGSADVSKCQYCRDK